MDDKSSILNAGGSSGLEVVCGAPEVQEISGDHHSFTYICSSVALEGASVDLHIAFDSSNCSALLSWMSPRDIEKIQESSTGHHPSTCPVSSVGVEGRVMDDKSSILDVDGAPPT
jgi:hypothetical protein